MNASMFKVLLICSLVGPAIAINRFINYSDVESFKSCIAITVLLASLAGFQKLLSYFFPTSLVTAFFGMFAFAVQLSFMAYVHVRVNITYAMIPIVSLFYCDKVIYVGGCIMNYVALFITNKFLIASYWAAWSQQPEDVWFKGAIGGYTIETVFIFVAGYFLCRRITEHFRKMYDDDVRIATTVKSEAHKSQMVQALTGRYLCVYNVHFRDLTCETVFADKAISYLIRDDGLAANIERCVYAFVEDEYVDEALKFMDLKVLPERLKAEKVVDFDCVGRLHGKCQLSFAVFEKDESGNVISAVFTLRKID